MHIRNPFKALLLAVIISAPLFASAQPLLKKEKPKANWQNLDLKADGQFGISTERAYKELLEGKKHTPVVVAVIDGGIDVEHEDLIKSIWTNSSEIADNKLDDDKNGYADDVHGWNFIGSKDGYNLQYDNMEITRILRRDMQKYKYANPDHLSKDELAKYKQYHELDDKLSEDYKKAEIYRSEIAKIRPYLDKFLRDVGRENPTRDEVMRHFPQDYMLAYIKKWVIENWDEYLVDWSEFMRDKIEDGYKYYDTQVKYHLNMDFDPRDSIGDNYDNSAERYYGNNRIGGPGNDHGTHVAGIIGAVRGNSIGIAGVANDVRIMAVRTVPNGDERDKDVANAIRYAAENGARVINMSFGKSYSYDKKAVDDAVKFAMSKDVLIVQAAGNDNEDTDVKPRFPSPKYEGGGTAQGWMIVGASSYLDDNELKASFSNYGKTSVDVFAPGTYIRSTIPDSKYRTLQGTSMAAPMVAGLAALIRSYYPKLTSVQVKEIIMKSVTKVKHNVKVRFEKEKIDKEKNKTVKETSKSMDFADLCVSGGIVNAYEALKLAATY